jgi:hypothetical protein
MSIVYNYEHWLGGQNLVLAVWWAGDGMVAFHGCFRQHGSTDL